MKIKKLIFIALTLVCMMSFSHAAFAADVTPQVIGIGDTRDTAIPLTPCNLLPGGCYPSWLPLASSSDVDWFSWINTTGTDRFVDIGLVSPASYNYALAYQIRYPSGALSSKVYAPDAGVGGVNNIESLYVPNGATLYMEVSPRASASTNALYGIFLLLR
ncbi:hypothetical protein PA598K_01660 [Paenibacillus sp. 598K]|uniref:hypothetical protein n=1 Tax=Paenibacillus sp. 598K TaxID=1117987 RepID=UPI000FF96C8B|nr:hypothetical protein [Paenibacillus sp. 598K]GBF73373.1 hypothetical protein PA598K_01660 [Paenibacillus sp. 598K]